MRQFQIGIIGLTPIILLLLSACSNGAPFIFKEGEFNRYAADFNKNLVDRKEVKICYNTTSSEAQNLLKIAERECGKYGRSAHFKNQDFLHCPLSTPAGATFLCVRP